MRKRCHRTRRPVSAPMLVNRGLVNTDLETRERMAVEAFCLGFATTAHYDQLADMRDCLLLSAAAKGDANTIAMCRASGVALMNIATRFKQTGRMGATGDELTILREFCTTYRDYWLRQPVTAYEIAVATLDRARQLNLNEVEIRA